LNSKTPLWTGACAVFKDTKALRDKHTHISRFDDAYTNYKVKDGNIYLPRESYPMGEDKRCTGMPVSYPDPLLGARNKEQERLLAESLKLFAKDESHILQASTGIGKCHGVDTPILMYDGTLKVVQDIRNGDTVMGAHSDLKVVSGVTTGTEKMYKVTPTTGDPFTCNSSHILSLKSLSCPVENNTLNISLKDYLDTSDSFKTDWKLWSTGVEFSHSTSTPADPYALGLLLTGCKTQHCTQLCGTEVVSTAYAYLSEHTASTGGIPYEYKTSTRETRLQVLAGIIDMLGAPVGCSYTVYVPDPILASDIVFLSRSLGLSCAISAATITLDGDVQEIPTLLTRTPHLSDEEYSTTAFKVTALGEGEYYGFCVQGDGLYLLGDFTVTHNTFLGVTIAQSLGLKTLIVVPKQDIMYQWRDACKKFLGLKSEDIGYIQADTCDVLGKTIVLGMVHSLCKDKYPSHIKREFGLVVYDEIQVMGAEGFSSACGMYNSKYRLGLSATPYRSDGKEHIFKEHIGEIKVVSSSLTLVPKIITMPSSFKLPRRVKEVRDKFTGRMTRVLAPIPVPMGRTMGVNKLLGKDRERNALIGKFVAAAYAKGRRTIIFSDLKGNHLEKLYPVLRSFGIPTKDISYYVGGMKEKDLDKAKAAPVILATYKMCSMATDIPWLDTCVLGTPRADVVQIVGRILREYEGKQEPVVLDILDSDSETFTQYYRKRLRWYRSINASVIKRACS